MAFARDVYTASPSQTDFTISFPYIAEADVNVFVDGTLKTQGAGNDYTIVTSTIVRFNSGLAGSETVVLQRKTSQSTRLVDWATSAVITEADLDNDSLQAFYMAQEAVDVASLALGLDTDDNWTAQSKRIKNVSDPTAAQDAATKAYGDANWGGASATAAAASAAAAASSASSASTSETNAAASYDSFDDRYLGAKSSDPALDNDGDALVTGALYFNTTSNELKVYSGSSWVAVGSTTFTVYTYVATGGQTVFTGADANANTMSFANANRLVFLNGVFLREGASFDYQASGGNTITLNTGANLNDVLEVFTAESFSVADAISQATGDARYLQISNNLSDVNNAATARSNIGAISASDLTEWSAWSSVDLTNSGANDTSNWTFISGASGLTDIEIVLVDGSGTISSATWRLTIGDSGGLETTGYASKAVDLPDGGVIRVTHATASFQLYDTGGANSQTHSYKIRLTHVGGNLWMADGLGNFSSATTTANHLAGTKTLSGELTQVDLALSSGNFDNGTLYYRTR